MQKQYCLSSLSNRRKWVPHVSNIQGHIKLKLLKPDISMVLEMIAVHHILINTFANNHHSFPASWQHVYIVNLVVMYISSCLGYIVTGATCGEGNAHSFRNTWFHTLWVHDFTNSLHILGCLSQVIIHVQPNMHKGRLRQLDYLITL